MSWTLRARHRTKKKKKPKKNKKVPAGKEQSQLYQNNNNNNNKSLIALSSSVHDFDWKRKAEDCPCTFLPVSTCCVRRQCHIKRERARLWRMGRASHSVRWSYISFGRSIRLIGTWCVTNCFPRRSCHHSLGLVAVQCLLSGRKDGGPVRKSWVLYPYSVCSCQQSLGLVAVQCLFLSSKPGSCIRTVFAPVIKAWVLYPYSVCYQDEKTEVLSGNPGCCIRTVFAIRTKRRRSCQEILGVVSVRMLARTAKK